MGCDAGYALPVAGNEGGRLVGALRRPFGLAMASKSGLGLHGTENGTCFFFVHCAVFHNAHCAACHTGNATAAEPSQLVCHNVTLKPGKSK